jgi:hypothetical protein
MRREWAMPEHQFAPVRQYHGVMFVDSDVKKRLKLELMRDGSL